MIASQKFAATPVSYRAIRVSEAEPVSSWVKEIDSGLENMTELNALCRYCFYICNRFFPTFKENLGILIS